MESINNVLPDEGPKTNAGESPPISADELDRLIEEEASDDANVTGTFSRADIYADHD